MSVDRRKEEEMRAFRRFARLGLDKEKEPLAFLRRIKRAGSESVVLDLFAVWETLRFLEAAGKCDTAEAARRVYFFAPEMKLMPNELTYRVICVAGELHCDERTLYRRLREARALWRKLRYNERY